MTVIFNEEYPEARASFNIEISRVLYSEKSPYQKIEILESPFFGKAGKTFPHSLHSKL